MCQCNIVFCTFASYLRRIIWIWFSLSWRRFRLQCLVFYEYAGCDLGVVSYYTKCSWCPKFAQSIKNRKSKYVILQWQDGIARRKSIHAIHTAKKCELMMTNKGQLTCFWACWQSQGPDRSRPRGWCTPRPLPPAPQPACNAKCRYVQGICGRSFIRLSLRPLPLPPPP